MRGPIKEDTDTDMTETFEGQEQDISNEHVGCMSIRYGAGIFF